MWLFEPQHYLSMLLKYFPSLDVDCDGVFSSSSSIKVLFFYSTSASWFASYFKIGNSYLLSSRSLSFYGSCMRFLLMNIGPFYSSATNIMLGIINGSCSCNLLVRLAMDYPHKFVVSCSQNMG